MREKRKFSARDISSTIVIISNIPMIGVCKDKFQTMCSNFTMIQRLTSSGSLFYKDKFECMREKERILKKEEEKMNLTGRESIETCHKCKK